MEESQLGERTYSYTIRKTPMLLVARIMMIEIIVMIVHYFLRLLIYAIARQLNVQATVPILTLELVGVQILNVVLLVMGVASWLNELYILHPKELVVKRGVLSSQATTYEFANLQSMTIAQTIWGKLFNYGNIRLYNPVLREEVIMSHISSPQQYGAIIQQHNPEITPLIRKRA